MNKNNAEKPESLENEPAFLSNQTQFEVEEPLFEGAHTPVAPAKKHAESAQEDVIQSKKILGKFTKKQTLLIGGVIAAVFLVVVILIAALSNLRRVVDTGFTDLTGNSTGTSGSLSNYEKRLQEAQEAWQAADPTISQDPLPPLNYTYYFDASSVLLPSN